jgi:hypothetical protein
MFSFDVKGITVLINLPGTDKIILETELPTALPLCHNLSPGFATETQKDTGVDYAFKNFNVDSIMVIDCNDGTKYMQMKDGTKVTQKRG